MALFNCPECGKEISDMAAACPHCGAPVQTKKYCKFCGAQIDSSCIACTVCGKPVDNLKSANANNAVNNTSNNPTTPNIAINSLSNASPVASATIVTPVNHGAPKNKWVSFFLCLFTVCGHKFYEGKIGMGILYLCTCGLFGIGWIIDLIALLAKPNPYYI
ncbi:MAG: NINE protein [Lachnospiraceae bacterium]|nr:NINE protein [Lachnospiraceae bacterium]